MYEIKIKNTNGVLTVSSMQIARDFGKRHDNVVRDIETLVNTIKGGCPQN
ncbi:MAG: Rha family transcriptional regulator [Ruminococcus flavefaciens]|nr:Rha family transcriptional regulator [Ruminococcus flavefaciens]